MTYTPFGARDGKSTSCIMRSEKELISLSEIAEEDKAHGVVHRPYVDKRHFRSSRPLEERRLARIAGMLRDIIREQQGFPDLQADQAVQRLWAMSTRLRPWEEDQTWAMRLEQVEISIKHLMEENKKEAIQQWKNRLHRHADPHSAKSYAFIKGDVHPGLCALRDQHDRVCLSLEAQDNAMRQFWSEISDRPAAADQQSAEFAEYVMQNCEEGWPPWSLPPLTLRDLQAAIARLKPRGAAGLDGWRPRELKALPPAAIEELMVVLAQCERAQMFPDLLRQGITTLIPKSKGALKPSQYRPITVRSTIWRSYARVRAAQMQTWQEQMLHDAQQGGRPHRSTASALAPAALIVEAAAAGVSSPVIGISYDFAKYFDRVLPENAATVWQRWGMAPQQARLIREAMASCVRRFKFHNGALGEPYLPQRGLVQGCPFSGVAALATLTPLCAKLQAVAQARGQEVFISSYMDDFFIIAADPDLAIALDAEVKHYTRIASLQLNEDKCTCYRAGAVPPYQWEKIKRLAYKETKTAEILKTRIDLEHARQPTTTTYYKEKMDIMQARLRKLKALPSAYARKAPLLAAAVLPPVTYAPIGPVDKKIVHVDKIHREFRAALHGRAESSTGLRQRAIELEYLLLRAPHRHHIVIAKVVELTNLLAFAYRYDPITTIQMVQCAAQGRQRGGHGICRGLVSNLHLLDAEVSRCGMYIEYGEMRAPLFCLDGRRGAWQHTLRELWRVKLTNALIVKRPAFEVIRGGVDRVATNAMLQKLGPSAQGLARAWMTDGLFYSTRLARRGMGDAVCRYCNMQEETGHHRLWECEAFQRCRFVPHQHVQTWPASFRCWGIIVEGWDTKAMPRNVIQLVFKQALLIHAAAMHLDAGRSLDDLPAAWGGELGIGSSWGAVRQAFSAIPCRLPDATIVHEDAARHGLFRREANDREEEGEAGDQRRNARGAQHNLTVVGPFTVCTLCGRRSVRPRKFATLPCHKRAPEQAPAHGTSLASRGGHVLVVEWEQGSPRVRCNRCMRFYKWGKRQEFSYYPCRGSLLLTGHLGILT